MDLLWVFKSLDATAWSQALQSSQWAFALIEMGHLISLAFLGGVLLLNNGNALWPSLGSGERLVAPYRIGVGATLATGFLLLLAEPMKCYEHPAFRWKMVLLGIGLLVQPWLGRLVQQGSGSACARWGAVASLVLWTGIGFAGRVIGFY
ncbi:hypothetical protein [Bryobacter aggregatus]|uniref:hypothetical protein n=1 Tax=Bryobacter aggregatus TaxID=360054 RepID=UPI0004E2414C|nr:hypothetical protein [Bryobacter aggregatus]